MPSLIGVYSGNVTRWESGRENFSTAIFKTPVSVEVSVSKEGIEGDCQADRKHHGGPDKAVCLYTNERYEYLQRLLKRTLPRPGLGENLLVSGIDEDNLYIGDILCIGSAMLQVSQPRRPCYKLGSIYGEPKLSNIMMETGYTGCYLRCIKDGTISAGKSFVVRHGEDNRFSIASVNRLLYGKEFHSKIVRDLLSLKSISGSLRLTLKKRLEGREEDHQLRIYGSASGEA